MTEINASENLRIVLFGPPGAGKGTQAQLLRERMGIEHVSSGDLFRHHLANGTELGELARGYMNRGELVPDDVTINMVLERIGLMRERDGFMLDGFPRNTNQARALDSALERQGKCLHRVIHISVPDDELIRRLSNRYICRVCQKPFARDAATGEPPIRCDDCADGGEIYQRADDTPDAVANRLAVYHAETAPVLEYYRDAGLLAGVVGNSPVETVNRCVMSALGLTAKV